MVPSSVAYKEWNIAGGGNDHQDEQRLWSC